MGFLTDERAQAIQVGAVLLFGILIILFSFWQSFIIPDQNEQIEFNHNEDIQQQMTQLRSTIVSMSGEQTPQSTTLALGVRYPSRLLFANPPPSEGLVQTNNTLDQSFSISLDNATAVNNSNPGVESFWNGTNRTYNTGSFEYSPDYARLQNAPKTIYEHTILYNEFDRLNSTSAVTGQTLVDGDRINLVTLGGQFEKSRSSRVSVDVEPISTQSRSVTITNESASEPVRFNLSTGLSNSQWNESLTNEPAQVIENGRNDSVVIELDPGEYELTMTRVGIGTGATEPDPAYIAGVSGAGVDDQGPISTDENETVTVEVRDTYNNPVSNVGLEATSSITNTTGLSVTPTEVETNTEGQATFTIDTSGINTANLNGSENATINISAENPTPFEGSAGTSVDINTTVDPPLSEQSSFDVGWNVTGINETDAFDCDVPERVCNISSGGSGEMNISINSGSSTPPSGKVELFVNNNNAGTFVDDDGNQKFETTFEGGNTNATFKSESVSPNNNKSTTVTVRGGGTRDQMTVNVKSVSLPGDAAHHYDATQQPDGKLENSGGNGAIIDQEGTADLNDRDDSPGNNYTINTGISGSDGFDIAAGSAPLDFDTNTGVQPSWTYIAVVNITKTGQAAPLFDQDGGGTDLLNLFLQEGGNTDQNKINIDGDTRNADVKTANEPTLVTAQVDADGDAWLNITNSRGSQDAVFGPGTVQFGGAGSNMKFFEDDNSDSIPGYVGEVTIFDSDYDQAIEDYEEKLKSKWGI